MEIYTKVEKTRIVSPRVDKCMDYSIKEYQPTRGGSRARVNYDSYLDMDDLNDTRDSLAPTRGRTSTPSAAVRRAMQVLDETYRKQSYLKQDRWSRSAEQGSFRPIRTRRSPSPIKSRSPSPIRSSPVNWTPPRLVEIERDNYQDALDDSESRREILLRKLADAQKTMEMQNERLREGEMDSSECRATIRLLQQVQQELETKTRFLEKEREDFMTRSRQGAEERETLRRKLEEGSRDSNRLRCQLDLLLADKEQHHVTLEHLHETINDLKSENKGTLELQATTGKDLDVTKERLNVCKQKCELLEKEKNHAFAEIEKQQKSQQALVNRNTDLGQRLSRCQHDLQDISERYDRNTNDLGNCKEELDICRDRLSKQGKDLNEVRRSYSEMQQDRERALKYNSELEKTVHSIKEINQDLKRAKVACEDELTELHGELAKIRLDFSRSCEENNIHMEDAKVLKKECAKLSAELSLFRPRAEELSERVKYLESTHNMDVQQMALLETQKNQTSRERDDLATRLSAQEESYSQLQNHHEEESKKLNQDLRDLRHEKEKLSTQLREAETQLSRIGEELKTSTQHSKSQIDHWRQACSKLTSLVEEKDEDLRQGAIYRRELDEKLALAEAERRTTQLQMGELQASEEELIQLRADNKRLGQECAENQQMITVLEMQRDILAKSPSKSTSQDSVLKAQVEKLQAEVSLLKTKLNQVEAERNDLERRLKVNGPRGDQSDLTDDVGRLKGMNQLLAEQLTKVRQEAETLQDIIEEKNRNLDHVTRQLEREKQQLELRMASMNDEMRALKSNQTHKSMEGATELRNLRADVIRLKQDLEEKRQQVMVMEGEKVILENGRKRVEDRADALEAKLDDLRKEKMLDDARGKSPVHAGDVERLSAELKRTNAKLETAKAEIASLRKRLNDYDGVRTSQDDVIQALKQQLEAQSSSNGESDAASSGTSQPTSRDVKSLKRDLLRAKEELAAKDRQLMELKRRFVETQKLEQKVRQERDELQGKTIIMESLNDSSRDVLQELDEVRQEKETLEKQLSIFLSSKTSQTPPTSLALGDDLDKELEKQYNTVCERNKWLETRIASLQREIELVRDQNSLLQEQRNSAEREASKLREEMKDLQMHTKGTRRKGEVEQIHLQHSNAEKLQQIMELERELNEKKQIIHAMAREMESLRKKSDKKKISNFMKKLKGSSTNSSRDLERSLPPYTASTSDGDPQWTTRSASLTQDTGYSSHGGKKDKKRSSSLSPKSRPASFGDFPKVRRNSSQPPSSRKSSRSVPPVSPTLTYVTGVDEVTDGAYSPKRGSPGGGSPGARVSFDESSDPEIGSVDPGEVPSSRGGDSTRDVSHEDAEDGDNVVFLSEDYMPEDQIMSARHRPSSRRSSGTPRPSGEPRPTKAEKLPSPTSSPSLPSPTSGRSRSVPVYITAASDESSEDTGSSYSEEFEEIGGKRDPLFPSKLVKSPFTELSLPNSSKSGENSPPPRPQSQPTLKVGVLTPKQIGGVRKKHSSLV